MRGAVVFSSPLLPLMLSFSAEKGRARQGFDHLWHSGPISRTARRRRARQENPLVRRSLELQSGIPLTSFRGRRDLFDAEESRRMTRAAHTLVSATGASASIESFAQVSPPSSSSRTSLTSFSARSSNASRTSSPKSTSPPRPATPATPAPPPPPPPSPLPRPTSPSQSPTLISPRHSRRTFRRLATGTGSSPTPLRTTTRPFLRRLRPRIGLRRLCRDRMEGGSRRGCWDRWRRRGNLLRCGVLCYPIQTNRLRSVCAFQVNREISASAWPFRSCWSICSSH